MPLYTFDEIGPDGKPTGKTEDFLFSMGEKPEEFTGEDGRKWRFNFIGTVKATRHTIAGYPHELECLSCHPSQVEEMRKRHPEVNYTSDGRAMTGSYGQTKRIMRQAGMVDLSGEWKR